MPLFKYHTNVMQNSLYLVKRVSSAKHMTFNLVLSLAKFSMGRYLRTQLPFLSPLEGFRIPRSSPIINNADTSDDDTQL